MSGSDISLAFLAAVTALVTATTALVVALRTHRAVVGIWLKPGSAAPEPPPSDADGLGVEAPVLDVVAARVDRHNEAFLRLAELLGPDTRRQLAALMGVADLDGDAPLENAIERRLEAMDGTTHLINSLQPRDAPVAPQDPP